MIAHAAELFSIPASTTPQAFAMVQDNIPIYLPLLYVLGGLLSLFFLVGALTSAAAGSGEHHETIDEWDL